jgi:elongation factor 1-alpha
MDSDMARYKEDRFLEIRNEIFSTLISVGWPRKFVEESVPVIPISAWEGKNIIEPAEEMPWWSGTSVIHPKTREHVHMTTFLDYLQDFVYVPDPPKIEATIATVTEGFRIKGVGYVVTAHVDAGTFRPSEKVKILPKRNAPEFTGTIQSIETHRLPISEAKFGYFCGFHIPEIQAGNLPRLGDVMCLNSDKNICRVKSFKVQIRVVSHPGELKIGYEPVAVVKTMLFAAKMTTILWKIGRKCPEKLESPLFVKQGEIAECIFVVQRPVVLLPFKELEGFGRVLFLEGGNISLIGKIVEVFE